MSWRTFQVAFALAAVVCAGAALGWGLAHSALVPPGFVTSLAAAFGLGVVFGLMSQEGGP